MNLDLPRAGTKIEPVIVQQTLDGSAVGRLQAINSEVLRSYLSLVVVLGLECNHDRSRYGSHAQIFVGVVMCISVYPLLGAYYLTTYCYKRMRLLTRFYGIFIIQPCASNLLPVYSTYLTTLDKYSGNGAEKLEVPNF